jgi:hypothetical protein
MDEMASVARTKRLSGWGMKSRADNDRKYTQKLDNDKGLRNGINRGNDSLPIWRREGS